MVYKPTRQSQTRLQPVAPAGSQGMFDVGKASQNLGKSLSALSQSVMQDTYNKAETQDVANAVLEGVKVLRPDGTINPDMASAAGKVWSDKGTQKYLSTIDSVVGKWSTINLSAAKDNYLLADPVGGNEQAKAAYQTEVSGLRDSIKNYPVAAADFELQLATNDSSVAISQAAETEKRRLTDELGKAQQATVQNTVSIGARLRQVGVEQGAPFIQQAMETHDLMIDSIETNPLRNSQSSRDVRTLTSNFQNAIALNGLVHDAQNLADASTRRNPANVYAPKAAFYNIAFKVENDPEYLKAKFGIEFDLVDRAALAKSIRAEGTVWNKNYADFRTELERPAAEMVDEWQYNNITLATDPSRLPTTKAIEAFVQTLPVENQYKFAVELTKGLQQHRNHLNERRRSSLAEDKLDLANQAGPHITYLRTGRATLGAADTEAGSIQALTAMLPMMKDHPNLTNAVMIAIDESLDRDQSNAKDHLALIEAQINANGFGVPENQTLLAQGDEIASQLEDKGALAAWITAKDSIADSKVRTNLDDDITRLRNGLPLKNYNNIEDMRADATALGGQLLNDITAADIARDKIEFGNQISEVRRRFETRFDPDDVDLAITPAAMEAALSTIEEDLKAASGPDKTSLESTLQYLNGIGNRYKDAYKIAIGIQEELSLLQKQRITDGAPVKKREFIEKHDPPPAYNPDDPSYLPKLRSFVAKYGIIPSDLLGFIDRSVMQSEEQANRTLSIFNDVIVHSVNNIPGLSPTRAREQMLTQLSDNSVAGRENAVRSSGMLRMLFEGIPFDTAQDLMTKGALNTSTFNSKMKGALPGFDMKAAEADPNYVFNILVDKTVELGDEGFWEKITEAMGWKEETVGEKKIQDWFASQMDQGKSWILQSFEASPNIKYILNSAFKREVVAAGNSGTLNNADIEGAVYRAWLSLDGIIGVQMEKVGHASFGEMAREQDLIDDPEGLELVPGPIGVVRAGIDVAGQYLGMQDNSVYVPRLSIRPIEPWLQTNGGLPNTLASDSQQILNYDITGAVRYAPDNFFLDKGTTKEEVLTALDRGMVYFRSNPLLGLEPGQASWDVTVKVGDNNVLSTVALFEDYKPNWNKMNLSGVYNAGVQDGVSLKILNQDIAKIYSYEKILGPLALRQAIRNEMSMSPDRSTGETVINAFNTVASAAGLEKISINANTLREYEQYFDLFMIR